ncbi:hypothetical protein KPSA3_05965 [Pseudomonas syringae pv. actinidiae]|uniref:Uncharacterized protein n=1 Tax=Pseudomonas syringae pv. actinidiae TaxID=103796 RepID=A0AAN4QA66_PSESF|nr:hypothetical protein KPSA3_05965 [Pseudomonas syringae pv. actinidiae]
MLCCFVVGSRFDAPDGTSSLIGSKQLMVSVFDSFARFCKVLQG